MERAATGAERAAILAALPRAALGDRGIASVLLERDGELLDGAHDLATDVTFVRPLPAGDAAALDVWLALLDRKRAQLAHDVSGPATGVLAALETVLEYEPIPASSRSILDDARGGMLRLSRMLADRTSMLGTRSPDDAARATVERAIAPIVETLDPYRERLSCTITGDAAEVAFDAALLTGVLHALITNSWKFRRGPSVHVTISASGASLLTLVVEDDGRGADTATSRRAGELGFTTRTSGVGLGLFLVRRAVSKRAGVVCVDAEEGRFRTTVIVRDPR